MYFLQIKSRTPRVIPHNYETYSHHSSQLASQGHISAVFVNHQANQNRIKRAKSLKAAPWKR